MPRIRCHYVDCTFLEEGYCRASAVEIDPSEGCMTYSPDDDLVEDEELWADEEVETFEEDWEGDEEFEEDDDFWSEEDEEL